MSPDPYSWNVGSCFQGERDAIVMRASFFFLLSFPFSFFHFWPWFRTVPRRAVANNVRCFATVFDDAGFILFTFLFSRPSAWARRFKRFRLHCNDI